MERLERLTVGCGEIGLEAAAHWPRERPAAAVVVCHPHPLFGGDMDNHVVVTLCQALAEGGLLALRFNFRGTGESGGRHDGGRGEQEDVLAALARARELLGGGDPPLGLAGYSFGAMVAALAAPRAAGLGALALVSPPTQYLTREALAACTCPKLIVSGENDSFARPEELQRLVQGDETAELVVLPRVDHFWALGFHTAAGRVVAFFRRHLASG